MKSLRSDRILNANYPLRFISSVIKQLDDKLRRKFIEKDDYILPPDFYEKKKSKVFWLRSHTSKKMKHLPKRSLQKFQVLANDLYELKTKWFTKTMRNLFRLKSKNRYATCVIYEEICTCKENYIGETKQNVEIQTLRH